MSSVQDFKSRSRRIVTLPSGLSVEIRKIRLMDFLDFGELPLPSSGSREKDGDSPRSVPPNHEKGTVPITAGEIQRFSSRAIVSGAVAPKFTDHDDEEHSEDLVHVRDLSWEDFQTLASEILEWSGHKKEAAAEAESFRAYRVGEDGPRAGEGVREATERDPANGSRGILFESSDNVPRGAEEKK